MLIIKVVVVCNVQPAPRIVAPRSAIALRLLPITDLSHKTPLGGVDMPHKTLLSGADLPHKTGRYDWWSTWLRFVDLPSCREICSQL